MIINAAIIAYNRIQISKLKMQVMRISDNVYYSNINNLITNILLSESLINFTKLNLLKLKYIVIKAIFNNNKTY